MVLETHLFSWDGTPQILEGVSYSKGLISYKVSARFLRICQEFMAQTKLENYLIIWMFSTCVFFKPWIFPENVARWTPKQLGNISIRRTIKPSPRGASFSHHL